MGLEFLRRGHKVDEVVLQQVGFDGGNAEPFHPVKVVQGFGQIQQTLAMRCAEISDVHAGQDDFLRSGFDGFARLGHGVGHVGASRSSAGQRDGAKRAEIVAAVLNLEESPRPIST